jgi:HAD superfamily hydrolase (TIGR01509 family)
MMGMSSPEWSRYMRDTIGLADEPEEISAEVVRRLEEIYRRELPLLPGAVETVRALAERWPLGLASSSNRELIDLVLEESGLAPLFAATVSSEEVERGKPAPDVYLEAARRLDAPPEACVAVEDSAAGIRSAHAAGMRVIAVPNRDFPPPAEALALAQAIVETVGEVTPTLVASLGT